MVLDFRRIVSHFVRSYGIVQKDGATNVHGETCASSPRFNYIRDRELVAALHRDGPPFPRNDRSDAEAYLEEMYRVIGGEGGV